MISRKCMVLVLFFLVVELYCDTGCEAATSLGRNDRITLTRIGDAAADVGIHSIRMAVVITGNIAQVRLNLLIANRCDEPRAGYLRMPLPDGSVVSEFAIDIKECMLDAMPLDSRRAESIWYKEASKYLLSLDESSSDSNGGGRRNNGAEAVRPTGVEAMAAAASKAALARARKKVVGAGEAIDRADERLSGGGIRRHTREEAVRKTSDNIIRANKTLSIYRTDLLLRAVEGKLSVETFRQCFRGGTIGRSISRREVQENTGKSAEEVRALFETARRMHILDPGLLSWDGDNRLRMQIFPIMPERSRCVTVGYTTELIRDGAYARLHIPLCFAGWVRSYDLIVVIDKTGAAPHVGLKGLPTPTFSKIRGGLIGSLTADHVMLPDSLAISFAKDDWEERSLQKASDGKVYFSLRPFNLESKKEVQTTRKQVSTAAILWDASSSERGKRQELFFRTLTAWLGTPEMKGREIKIDVIPFHLREEESVCFTVSDSSTGPLFNYLKSCHYDGRASLNLKFKSKWHDLHLLFTNGHGSSQESLTMKFPAPVFVFSQGPGANASFLSKIARASGGCYFDLNRTQPADAALCMSSPPKAFNKALVSSGKVKKLFSCPWYRPEAGNLLIGRLDTPSAEGTLLYGNDNLLSIPFSLTAEDATEGEELRILWARKAALADRAKTSELGRKHHIITPGTSMLVMEEMEQYRVHGLPFPKRLLTLTRIQKRKTPGITPKPHGAKSVKEAGTFEVILPKAIKKDKLVKAYAEQAKHGQRPASFYLAWARVMIQHRKEDEALRILSNLRELDLIDNNSYAGVLAFQGWASKYKRGRFWRREEKMLKMLLQPPWYSASLKGVKTR